MSRSTDNLELAYGDFNQTYAQVRKYIKKELRKENPPSPEGLTALTMLEQLDVTLDELVTCIIKLDRKISNSTKK